MAASETKRYTLPPGKYEQAVAYSHSQYLMYFLGISWAAGSLLLIVRARLAPKLRTWAESASRIRFLQACIFVPALLLVWDAAQFPLDVVQQRIQLHYDLSVQSWRSWLLDWTKGESIKFAAASVLAWTLYALIRRSPRQWWSYFWLACLPVIVFVLFVQPLLIDPLFFHFEPLALTQPNLVDSIERVVSRGDLHIPPNRIFLMKASEKVNSINAYVTGIGGSKRVVVWDNTIAKMNLSQVLFVFGHEMGHYVLGHIPKEIAILSVLLLGVLYAGYRAMIWALGRWGREWEIRGVEDWASLPLLLLIVTVCVFLCQPVVSTVSRYFEHEADVYGTEVTFSLIPPAAEVGAEAFQILGEIDLAEPDPNPFIEFWLYSHPSIAKRIAFVQQYDPWSHNQTHYVH